MKETHKKRLVNGIIVMSNSYLLFGILAVMVIIGWITMAKIGPILMSVALAYLILSIVGGTLAKSIQEKG